MKIVYSILLILLIAGNILAQGVYEKSAKEICLCVNDIGNLKPQARYQKFEKCTNVVVTSNEKEFIKQDKIDFKSTASIEKMMEKLSSKIMINCPSQYAEIISKMGEVTALKTIEGKIIEVEESRYLKLHIRDNQNKEYILIILNEFPGAAQNLEYILANRDKDYKFEIKRSFILDLDVATFKEYLEITKIIVLK